MAACIDSHIQLIYSVNCWIRNDMCTAQSLVFLTSEEKSNFLSFRDSLALLHSGLKGLTGCQLFGCKDINTGPTSSREICTNINMFSTPISSYQGPLRTLRHRVNEQFANRKETILTGRKLLTSWILTKRATLMLNSEIRNDNKSACSSKGTWARKVQSWIPAPVMITGPHILSLVIPIASIEERITAFWNLQFCEWNRVTKAWG